MIEVRLFANLAEHSCSRRRRVDIPPREGLTVEGILRDEGIDSALVRIIMVNGVHVTLTAEVHDGDRVALFPPVGGG